jgi:hypothetical protein
MVTGGDYSTETSTKAYALCGFSYFVKKPIFEEKPEKYIDTIIGVKGVQQKWQKRKALKEALVKKIFRDVLEDSDRKRLTKKAAAGSLTQHDIIKIGERSYTIGQLLCGWKEPTTLLLIELNSLISDLLHETDPKIAFNGSNWKRGYERLMLDEYLESEHHETAMDTIEFASLNLLLEVLAIRKEYDGEVEKCLTKNTIPLFCHSCKSDAQDNDSIFEQKMIARRVFFAHSYLYPKGDQILTLDILFSLLKRNITVDHEADALIDTGELSGKLGLFSKPVITKTIVFSDKDGRTKKRKKRISQVIATRKTMLLEEFRWLKQTAALAPAIRNFLDDFDPPKSLSNSLQNKFTESIDISDFRHALDMTKQYHLSAYQETLQRVRDAVQFLPEISPIISKYLRIDL